MLTDPIDFALQSTIKQLDGRRSDAEKLVVEELKRSQAMWRTIRIYNLDNYGLTYEQFCEQCETKNNLLFLSNEELRKIAKIIKIISIFEQEDIMPKE